MRMKTGAVMTVGTYGGKKKKQKKPQKSSLNLNQGGMSDILGI